MQQPSRTTRQINQLEGMKNSVMDMSSLGEWDYVRSKGPAAEVVGAKMSVGIKDYELLKGDDLADAVWKGRMVCTRNCIKSSDGKMVSNMDALYTAPIDLHNARLVVLYGEVAVLQRPLVNNAYIVPLQIATTPVSFRSLVKATLGKGLVCTPNCQSRGACVMLWQYLCGIFGKALRFAAFSCRTVSLRTRDGACNDVKCCV